MTQCSHCQEGWLAVDESLAICACSTCGRVDDTYSFVQDGAPTQMTLVAETAEVDSTWIEAIELYGTNLKLPRKAVMEAKTLLSGCDRKQGHSRKRLAAVLLLMACRRLHIPMTPYEVATAINDDIRLFFKHYTKLISKMGVEVPLPNPRDFVDRMLAEIDSGSIQKRQRQKLTELSHTLTELVSSDCPSFDPLSFSAAVLIVAWETTLGAENRRLHEFLDRRYGMKAGVVKRLHYQLRKHLVNLSSKIPGITTEVLNVRNILQFLPTLTNYHHNLSLFKKSRDDAPDRNRQTGVVKTPRTDSIRNKNLTHLQRSSFITLRHCLRDHSADNGENDQEMRRSLQSRERRERGFQKFIEQRNAIRRHKGKAIINPFPLTTPLSNDGKCKGYSMSLPLVHSTGDVCEIRRGPFTPRPIKKRKSVRGRLQTPPLSRDPGMPSPGDGPLDEDEIDSYILSQNERRLRQICYETFKETPASLK